MVSRLVGPGCEAVQAGTPPRGHTEPCRVRIETAMRGDKDGGEARVARAEIARAVASGSSMEIEPPLAAPMEPPPPPSSSSAMFGAETPRAGLMPGAERPASVRAQVHQGKEQLLKVVMKL